MKYTLNTVKITALLAVIGFTFFASLYLAGCDNGTVPTGTAPTITTTSLPGGTVGTPYSQTLTATGDAPITWSVEQGALPNGLTLSIAGVISGTPTAADACHFTVKATNAAGSGTKPLSITITDGGDSEERWFSQYSESTASLDHFSIDSDSVVKVTVGGTPELDAESWKVRVSYPYTAKTNTPYTYTFMAKTESGTRKLFVLYYGDSASDTWFIRDVDLTSSWQTFTIEGQAIPKAGIHAVDFRGANEIGTFYVKMISIAETVSGNGGGDPALPTPHVNDYTISNNLTQTAGSVTAITITPKYDKSGGAVTVYYEGTGGTNYEKSASRPSAVGLYAVTFDVAAAAGWNAAFGLFAGNLTITGVDSMETAIALTENIWADGNIPTSNGEQWFSFTATANTQYLHVSFGTLTDLYVQVYNSAGSEVGSQTYLYIYEKSTSRTLTVGQTYYVKVTPYSSSYSGTYRIAFNASDTPPPITLPTTGVTPLTENVWADGNIPTSDGEQWFSFTATADEQYIHFEPGALPYVLVQVYNSEGADVLDGYIWVFGSMKYISQTLAVGQTYYVKVTPYSSSGSGTYKIGFNTLFIPPSVSVTPLTLNTWADGNIPTSNGEQWFSFTATAATQYIHFQPGTLNDVYVHVYNSAGTEVGSRADLYNIENSTSRTLSVEQAYYIKVTSYISSESGTYISGTYRIAFNESIAPPGAIPLILNIWADGNIPTNAGEQGFSFTATAATQYLHFSFGTLTDLYVWVYSADTEFVDPTRLSGSPGSTKYTSQTLTVGQTYYVRVTASYDSGTYKIGFNTSTTLPLVVTQLTLNTWADGNIPTSGGEQWFRFTATVEYQRLHVSFGTLTDLYVHVYNSEGTEVGSQANLYGSAKYTTRTLTVGQTYYVKVTPYSSSGSGTYRIAFNASTTPPN